MQNRCSVSWPKVLLPELYQPPSPSPRPASPKQSTVVQNSYLLSLPLECLQQIILLLDIESLFQFRRTAIGWSVYPVSMRKVVLVTKHI
ncbi:hypothetical protein HYE67_001481 [Fusarium culmorum]|uniref:F-box domain-containing protein n=1 Tax=Fusarium culmorum TaxID=5516 RepID=A0A2T4GUJ8_FUSCU|nr:hypothetical protein FCULG_00005624 [Fusarium culmorum]QPC59250.1 hypothetical protein HYE67_001481 [Fusarium culmorum]